MRPCQTVPGREQLTEESSCKVTPETQARWRLNSKKQLARAGAVALGRQAHRQGGGVVWEQGWHWRAEHTRRPGQSAGERLPGTGSRSPRTPARAGIASSPRAARPRPARSARFPPPSRARGLTPAAPPRPLPPRRPRRPPPRVRPGVPGSPRPERRAPELARPRALGPRGASRAGTQPAARRPSRVPGRQVPAPLT